MKTPTPWLTKRLTVVLILGALLTAAVLLKLTLRRARSDLLTTLPPVASIMKRDSGFTTSRGPLLPLERRTIHPGTGSTEAHLGWTPQIAESLVAGNPSQNLLGVLSPGSESRVNPEIRALLVSADSLQQRLATVLDSLAESKSGGQKAFRQAHKAVASKQSP